MRDSRIGRTDADKVESLYWSLGAAREAGEAWRERAERAEARVAELEANIKEIQDGRFTVNDALVWHKGRGDTAEADRDIWHKIAREEGQRVEALTARVAELDEQLRLTRAWREAWIEHYAKARDGKKRVEADRDAALDLLREAVGILHDARDEEDLYDDGGIVDDYLDRGDAFLARVDSGAAEGTP